MSIQVIDVWLAVAGIVLSGIIMLILLLVKRSFGVYTERIERANDGVRRAIEMDRHERERTNDDVRLAIEMDRAERDKAREYNIAVLREVMQLKKDIELWSA